MTITRLRAAEVLQAIGSAFSGIPGPCEERDAITLAMVALAAPTAEQPMTHAEAKVIAQACAYAKHHQHGYLPTSAAAAKEWQPHEWVLDAIRWRSPRAPDFSDLVPALPMPEGYTLVEFFPGAWHYTFDRDGETMASGTTWNHPALAAIDAWRYMA